MADELQALLDRIQQDGVSKAEVEAARIVASARDDAAQIVAEADRRAEVAHVKAEEDSRLFAKRGEAALQQAARDVVLIVQDSVCRAFQALADQQVAAALNPQLMEQLLSSVVRAYFTQDGTQRKVDVLVSDDQATQLNASLTAAFRDAMRSGLTVQADPGIAGGFKVRLVGEKVQHDFSREAVAEALGRLVRPQLAAIIRQAVQGGTGA